jgi:Tol biopolymer transport system component/DNA-binding winged helix-turn-helix (wHTH) protein
VSAERYEFGDITVDLGRIEVRRAGQPVALEPKTFEVLRHLIQNRDRVVSKDELLDIVWKDTFVTPGVLTRVVAQLRKGLGDDASEARYVETVVKRGYRFIAPVRVSETGESASPRGASPRPTPEHPPLHAWRKAYTLLAVLAVVAAVALVVFWSSRTPAVQPEKASAALLRRLTVEPDTYAGPDMAPGGHAIAYASSRTGSSEIVTIGTAPGSRPVQVTSDGGGNVHPAFSPDGQWLAYHSRRRGGIWIVPALRGQPRQVSEFGSRPSWSPDSRRIVFTSDEGGLSAQAVLWTVDRDGAAPVQITQLGDPPGGHLAPSCSPDGQLIVFSVGGSVRREIWLADSNGRQPRRVATDAKPVPPRFSPSSDAVYWIGATEDGNDSLMRVSIGRDGDVVSAPEVVFPFTGGNTPAGFGIARDGTAIVSLSHDTSNLFALGLGGDHSPTDLVQLTHDDAQNVYPEFGPSGRILYQQEVTGRPVTAWVMDADGGNKEILLPGLGSSARMPQWNPHRQLLLVLLHERPGASSSLAWADLSTRRLTRIGSAGGGPPSLAPDGQRLAFHLIGSDGVMNVWIERLEDPSRRQITFDREAVTFPRWSADGRWLAVTLKRDSQTHVGIVSAEGSPVEQLTFGRGQHWPYSFSPDSEQIAFAGEHDGVWNIYAVSRKTKQVTQLTHFTSDAGHARFPRWSPDGTRIVFVRAESSASLWTLQLTF